MGKRTGRRRGAPKGNCNRLVHGRYSADAIARRRVLAADERESLALQDAVLLLEHADRLENALRTIGRLGLLDAARGSHANANSKIKVLWNPPPRPRNDP